MARQSKGNEERRVVKQPEKIEKEKKHHERIKSKNNVH